MSAGVGSALGGMDAATNKFLSGAIKLGTAAAGKTAEYATYAAYSLAEGGTLLDAYDNMGGLTINIANLGAILDLAGSVIARGNNDNQSIFGDGKILQKLSEIGLLEVNFGSEGVSTAIGMGGIDVGGAVYEQVKRGIDYAGLKSYAKEEQNSWKADMAWKTYVYGDFTQENTAMRLANGKDDLILVGKGGLGSETRYGHTVQKDGGGRTITIADMGYADNVSALGHEAYRDGLTPDENYLETRQSVMAHTELAARMRDAGYRFNAEGVIRQDLAVYDYARSVGDMSIMDAYADMVYRSDGDYMDVDTVLFGKEYNALGGLEKNTGEKLGFLGIDLILRGTFNQLFGEHFMRTGVEYNNTPDAVSNNAERVLGLWNEIEKKGNGKTIKEVAKQSDLVNLFNSMADGGILEFVKFEGDVKKYMKRTTAILSDGTKITYRLESSASSGNLPTIDIDWPKSWGKKNSKVHITYPPEDEKNKMKTNAFTDALIKKLEGFRIDGCVSELLAEGMSDLIYSGWLSNNGIYGAAEDFPDEFDPELLRIIHEKREGREKLEFERAMNMVIIRKVLEEGLMMINDDGAGFDEDFTSWLLSVDDSVQKVYDLWEKEFADNKTEDSIDRYMYALSNTDLGNEMGKKVLRKICRGEIAAAEKAIELEPNGIGGYVGRGNAYYDLMYYEPDPIKKAAYKKKAREITETIRKMDPDDTRHDNRDRADAYYFFSEIESDREKAREYTDKARAIRGLDSLAESESMQKAAEDKWKKKCKDDPKYTKFYFTIMLGVPYEKLIEPGFAEKYADYLYAVGLTPVEAEELFKSMRADSEAASESKRKYFGDMPADFLNAIGINPDVTKELFTKLIKEVISEIPTDFLNAIGFNPDVTEELFTKSMKEALSEMKKEINE